MTDYELIKDNMLPNTHGSPERGCFLPVFLLRKTYERPSYFKTEPFAASSIPIKSSVDPASA